MTALRREDAERLAQLQRQLDAKSRLETEQALYRLLKEYDMLAAGIDPLRRQLLDALTRGELDIAVRLAQQLDSKLAAALQALGPVEEAAIVAMLGQAALRGVQAVELAPLLAMKSGAKLDELLTIFDQVAAVGKAGTVDISFGIAFGVSEEVKKQVIKRIYQDGLNLSERLHVRLAEKRLEFNALLEEGLKEGRAAIRLGKQIAKLDITDARLPKYLQRLEAAVKGTSQESIAKAVHAAWQEAAKRKAGELGIQGVSNKVIRAAMTGNAEKLDVAINEFLQRKARYHAIVIARTETSSAFLEAHKQRAMKAPWVKGIKWNLSASHPRVDICDTLATQDLFGLGPGVYKPEALPGLPHPQCKCFWTDVIDSEKVSQVGAPNQSKLAQQETAATTIPGVPKPAAKPKPISRPRQVKLSDQEKRDIGYYTTGAHEQINAALRGEEPLTPQIIKTAEAVNKGLLKLPSYQGVSYRVVDFDDQNKLDAFLNAHQVGNKVRYRAFTSTSLDPNIWGGRNLSTKFRTRVTIKVNGKTGKDIAAYSRYPDEKEILFPMKSRFIVTKAEKNSSGGYDIEMEEAP